MITTLFVYHGYPLDSNIDQGVDAIIVDRRYQTIIDSLKSVQKKNKKTFKYYPFNPNFITDYKGYMLGLTTVELDRIFDFRRQDKWMHTKEDFKKVSGVSDSLLERLAPLFRFPKWETKKFIDASKKVQRHSRIKLTKQHKKDLNLATAEELQQNLTIPDFIVHRIIKYRDKIGGFRGMLQLQDVYGLYTTQIENICKKYTLKISKLPNKLNINKATVKELMQVPYFDFETALEIHDFIEKSGKINSFEELINIEGFPRYKIERIALYLNIN